MHAHAHPRLLHPCLRLEQLTRKPDPGGVRSGCVKVSTPAEGTVSVSRTCTVLRCGTTIS